jgi:hypothetical protein
MVTDFTEPYRDRSGWHSDCDESCNRDSYSSCFCDCHAYPGHRYPDAIPPDSNSNPNLDARTLPRPGSQPQ